MPMTYKTRDGDMLDAICFKHYGRENAVTDVLNANPGLAEYGAILPSGLSITLPELTTNPVTDNEATSLWD